MRPSQQLSDNYFRIKNMNTPEIIIYDSHVAPSIAVVQRALNFKNLSFSIGGTQKPTKEISIIGNISRQVAMASIDGKSYYDVATIVQAIEAIQPAPTFWPENQSDKSACELLMDWFDQSFFWHVMALRWVPPANAVASFQQVSGVYPKWMRPFIFLSAKRMLLKKFKAQGLGLLNEEALLESMQAKLASLAGLLGESDWLLGERLGIADVYLCSYLEFALLGVIPQFAEMVVVHPKLTAHSERVFAEVGMPVWPEFEQSISKSN